MVHLVGFTIETRNYIVVFQIFNCLWLYQITSRFQFLIWKCTFVRATQCKLRHTTELR